MREQIVEQMIAANRAWKRVMKLEDEYRGARDRVSELEARVLDAKKAHEAENSMLSSLLSKASDDDLPDFKLFGCAGSEKLVDGEPRK